MRINFVSRIDPFRGSGGGEVVLRTLLQYGMDGRYIDSIKTITPENVDEFDFEADFSIFADLFNFPQSHVRFDYDWLKKAMSYVPYFTFHNGYVDMCGLDYFPCSGYEDEMANCRAHGTDCLFMHSTVRSMFKNALTSYMVSPLQIEVMESLVETRRSFPVKPLIDTEKFRDANLVRDIPYLYVGTICEGKGVFNIMDWAKENNIDPVDIAFVGDNISGVDLSLMGFQYVPKLPYEDLPEVFNRTVNFVHLPRLPEPQGRAVVEAALCGCNLIVNEHVGATSFDFDISNPKNIDNAAQEFWEDILTQLGVDLPVSQEHQE